MNGFRWPWRPRLPAVPRRIAAGDLRVPGEAWSRRADFLAVRDGMGHERLKAQWQVRVALPIALAEEGVSGLCVLCGTRQTFGTPGDAASFDHREGLACGRCGINARMRHALSLLLEGLDPATARIYLTEQASPGFVWLQRWYEDMGGVGPLREADVTALPHADASLEAIGSFDVLEHVPDYRAALREFARALAPGGRLVLTVPFIETEQQTLVRARLDAAGQVEHLLPPEIHGDPVSGGVLCFYHFGWDLLDALREAGFREAEWVRTFAPEYALFGLWTLRARR